MILVYLFLAFLFFILFVDAIVIRDLTRNRQKSETTEPINRPHPSPIVIIETE